MVEDGVISDLPVVEGIGKRRVGLILIVVLVLLVTAFAIRVRREGQVVYKYFQEVWGRNEGKVVEWGFKEREEDIQVNQKIKLLQDNLKIKGEMEGVLNTFTKLYEVTSGDRIEYYIDSGLVANLIDSKINSELINYGLDEFGRGYIPASVLGEIYGVGLEFNEGTLELEAQGIPILMESRAPVGGLDAYSTPAHTSLERLEDLLVNNSEDWTLEITIGDGKWFYVVSSKQGEIRYRGGWVYGLDSGDVIEGAGGIEGEIIGEEFPSELREILEVDYSYNLLVEYGKGDFSGEYFYERHVVLGQREMQIFMDDYGVLKGYVEVIRDGGVRTVVLERKYGYSEELFSDILDVDGIGEAVTDYIDDGR
jgi:hypothetical protein